MPKNDVNGVNAFHKKLIQSKNRIVQFLLYDCSAVLTAVREVAGLNPGAASIFGLLK